MNELKKCPMCGSSRIQIVGHLYKRVSCKTAERNQLDVEKKIEP